MLFVMGFGTSMVLGPFIGQLADQFGRKNMILFMYCGAYALACVTKHFDLYWMLAIGRFLGGAATSVLFSCFESWLVAEYSATGKGAQIGDDGRHFPNFDGLSAKWDTGAEYVALFPNVLFGVHRDHYFAIILTPDGPEKTIKQIEI